MKRVLASISALFLGIALLPAQSQSLDPAKLLKPATDSWPTYSGDYTGRRYSPLTQINQSNVKDLALAWATRLASGTVPAPGAPPVIVGGEGTLAVTGGSGIDRGIRGAVLQVDGVLYATMPDNVWAVDARDGHEIWHYFWKTKGGTHTTNKGVGMWKNWIYVEMADNYLVCLDAKTGKERWHKSISNFDEQYFSSMAPIVIGNHLLVGTGNDLDEPGFLQSLDPDTGERQWIFYTVPMKAGDPGIETWANADASSHGGGNVWVPGSYDPDTHLYIFGTGNPTAAYTSQLRGPGDNLYTCTLVAINVDTGKMAWYYQTSPHDTHDFDSAQTPILVDGDFNGKPRRMVLTGARNGYFFVLDRTTGEHLVTGKLSNTINWSKPDLDKNGAPVHDPEKDYAIGGALVNGSVTNFPPPAFSPDTGLMYVPTSDNYHMVYLTTTDKRGAMGLGGIQEVPVISFGSYVTAMDYKTGKIAWQHRYPTASTQPGGGLNGMLVTAGKLLFTGDPSGNFIAFDPANGKPLWHSHVGVSNWPETYMLDGHQYVLVASNDSLYAFRLN
ncbi:MAG TPA: acido-empty-quinoprotein group A [Granulicella sp.]